MSIFIYNYEIKNENVKKKFTNLWIFNFIFFKKIINVDIIFRIRTKLLLSLERNDAQKVLVRISKSNLYIETKRIT